MKYRKFVIVSDVHGDQMDEGACQSAIRFTKEFNPDVRVIAGDLWDFGAIRRGASQDEQACSMRDDYDAGAGFAKRFFNAKSENHLMLGNHDVRAWDLAESSDAVRADLGQMMVADIEAMAASCKAKLWPYDSRDGVLELGHLKVVHGYHTGMAACAAHSRIYGNVVFGHIHSIESFQTPGLKQQEARSIGCLCKIDQPYANRKTGKLRWSNGWGYGFLHDDGTYTIHQARRIGEHFYASTQIKAF